MAQVVKVWIRFNTQELTIGKSWDLTRALHQQDSMEPHLIEFFCGSNRILFYFICRTQTSPVFLNRLKKSEERKKLTVPSFGAMNKNPEFLVSKETKKCRQFNFKIS